MSKKDEVFSGRFPGNWYQRLNKQIDCCCYKKNSRKARINSGAFALLLYLKFKFMGNMNEDTEDANFQNVFSPCT
jgi:hypothetical protein